MTWTRRLGILGTGTALTFAVGVGGTGTAIASPMTHAAGSATPPLIVKVIGHLANGQPKITSATPTGLAPSAIQSVYNLSGLTPSSGPGPGRLSLSSMPSTTRTRCLT